MNSMHAEESVTEVATTTEQHATEHDDMLRDWGAFDVVFTEFCTSHPQMGMQPGRHRAARVRSVYGDELVALGVAVRLPNRQWMAHRRLFGDAFATLYLGKAARIITAANDRSAAAMQEGAR